MYVATSTHRCDVVPDATISCTFFVFCFLLLPINPSRLRTKRRTSLFWYPHPRRRFAPPGYLAPPFRMEHVNYIKSPPRVEVASGMTKILFSPSSLSYHFHQFGIVGWCARSRGKDIRFGGANGCCLGRFSLRTATFSPAGVGLVPCTKVWVPLYRGLSSPNGHAGRVPLPSRTMYLRTDGRESAQRFEMWLQITVRQATRCAAFLKFLATSSGVTATAKSCCAPPPICGGDKVSDY